MTIRCTHVCFLLLRNTACSGCATQLKYPLPHSANVPFIAVPPGAFPHPASAELKFVLTSPELGLSIKESPVSTVPPTPITATYNPESSTYQVSDAAFVALQKRISDLVLGWINEMEKGQEKKGGNYEVQVEATIQPISTLPPVAIENSLTLFIKLNVAP